MRKLFSQITTLCFVFVLCLAFSVCLHAEAGTTTASQEATSKTAAETTTEKQPEVKAAPAVPTVTEVRSGAKRVKIYWNTVQGAEGYCVYMSSNSKVSFEKVADIANGEEGKYTKTGLVKGSTYFFYVTSYVKNENGTISESASSTVVSGKPVAIHATSKAPAKYSSKTSFTKSAAYRKYSGIKNNYYYNKSFAIPGLKYTNVSGFENKTMVPQDMCFAGGYLLISAYDRSGKDESVIYVLSKASKSYITTIVLPDKAQVSGMTYDGRQIWLTGRNCLMSIPFSAVQTAANNGAAYYTLKVYDKTVPVNMTTSFCCYYNNVLWVGSYNATAATTAYGYTLTEANGTVSLTQLYKMKIPKATRSMAIDSSGKMYLTRSYRTSSSKSGYISKIASYTPDFVHPTATSSIAKGSAKKTITLPPLVGGVAVKGAYVYVSFSSVRYPSCKYPVDRVIALRQSKL